MIGLILSANRITRLAFDPVAGRLVDRFGAKFRSPRGIAAMIAATVPIALWTCRRERAWRAASPPVNR